MIENALRFLRLLPPAPVRPAPTGDRTPTPANPRGPFFRRGAPLRDRLCDQDEPGEPLRVEGAILCGPERTPCPGVELDVWQADHRGLYSNMTGLRRSSPRAFRFRARVEVNADGTFVLHTRVPGHYPLGPFTRARHIHLIVRAPGRPELTTQLYFEKDDRLGADPFVRPELVLRLAHAEDVDGRSGWSARCELVLE